MSEKTSLKFNKKWNNNNNVFTQKEKKYRQEASRKVSMANKRLKRLEEQNLTMSPAYKKWLDEGGQKFGIRGKDTDEVRAMVSMINKFLNYSTSTVRGTKKYLDNVASQVGITNYNSYQSLNSQLQDFFEVSDRVMEYLKNSKEVSVSIGYKKIWEQVNEYAETVGKEYDSLNQDIVEIAKSITMANAYNKLDDLTDKFLKDFIDSI